MPEEPLVCPRCGWNYTWHVCNRCGLYFTTGQTVIPLSEFLRLGRTIWPPA